MKLYLTKKSFKDFDIYKYNIKIIIIIIICEMNNLLFCDIQFPDPYNKLIIIMIDNISLQFIFKIFENF